MDVPFNLEEEPRRERQSHVDIQRLARRLGNAELRRIERQAGGSQDPDTHPSSLPGPVKAALQIILFLVLAYCGFEILLLLIIALENIL